MLSADFTERYQTVRQVTEGAVRTFHAVAQTGAVVMVHVVAPQAREEHGRILGLMDRLDPNARERIVEVGEVDGGPVIVTRFLPEFQSLGQWLEAHGRDPQPGEQPGREPPAPAPPAPTPAPPAPTPGPPASAAGEFTRLFRQQARADDPGAGSSAEPLGTDVPSREQSAKKPGEFTQLFRSPSLENPLPEAQPHSPAPPQPDPPAPPRPDPPAPPQPPPAAPDHAEQRGPGEFTRWFARQTGLPPEDAAPEEPGLSYRGRGTDGGSGGPAHVDWRSRLTSEPSTGDASPPSGVPGAGAGGEPIVPGGANPPPPPTPIPTGPGEYTRVLSSGQAAAVPSAPSPAPLPPPPTSSSGGPSRGLLIWGLAGIVVVAVLTVVLFALLARERPAPAEPSADERQESPADAPPGEGR